MLAGSCGGIAALSILGKIRMSGRLVGLVLPLASMVVGACGYQGMCSVALAVRSPPSASTKMAQFPMVVLFLIAAAIRVVAFPCRFNLMLVIFGCWQKPRICPWVSGPVLQMVQVEDGVFTGFMM